MSAKVAMISLDKDKIQQIISSFHVPAKPAILDDLQREQSQEYPNLNFIADLIASDVSLAAHVLKTINSPVFGLNRTVTDIRQSVMMLGLNTIGQIIPFYTLRNAMADKKAAISMERFWDTSMETANLMAFILKYLNIQLPIEDVYSAGLFHDCGIALLAIKFADYKDVLQESNLNQRTLIDLEEEKYNTAHNTLGYFVASSWNLPPHTCELILRHHDQTLLTDSHVDAKGKEIFCIFKMAENILTEHRRQKSHKDWEWAGEAVLFYLGLSEHDFTDLKADVLEDLETLG